jgi:predicted Zn-dependent peptidase
VSAIDLSSGRPILAARRRTLACGLDVVVHADPDARLVAVNVWYRVGSTDEAPGQSGFAHLYEHLFKNSVHLRDRHHYTILREAGASGNASTNPDRTAYHEVVPPAELDLALWLESDRMGYFLPAFDRRRLAAQQAVVRSERRQRYEVAPYGVERFAIAEALYPEGHPQRYLTIGRHDDIQSATVEQVADFYRTWYVPANAQLVIAGAVDPDVADAAVDRFFGSFPLSRRPVRRAIPAPVIERPVVVAVDDRFAALRRIHRAWHAPLPDTPAETALDVLAPALVAPGTGALWKQLVYDRPLAQRVSAWQSTSRLGGEWHVSVDLRTGADAAAVRAILDTEIDRARRGDIDPRALARIRARREAAATWRLEGVANRASAIQHGLLYDDDPQGLALALDRIAAVDVAAATAAARDWLRPDAMVEVETRPTGPASDRERS